MIQFIIVALIITAFYSVCLWFTHKAVHWQYIGLVQIAVTGCYLISIFYVASELFRESLQ